MRDVNMDHHLHPPQRRKLSDEDCRQHLHTPQRRKLSDECCCQQAETPGWRSVAPYDNIESENRDPEKNNVKPYDYVSYAECKQGAFTTRFPPIILFNDGIRMTKNIETTGKPQSFTEFHLESWLDPKRHIPKSHPKPTVDDNDSDSRKVKWLQKRKRVRPTSFSSEDENNVSSSDDESDELDECFSDTRKKRRSMQMSPTLRERDSLYKNEECDTMMDDEAGDNSVQVNALHTNGDESDNGLKSDDGLKSQV